MKQQFEAIMFVTLSYKGNNNVRDAEKTLKQYINDAGTNGINITDTELIKENKKSGKHDGYAMGNYYKIKGIAPKLKTKDSTIFNIFHNCRHDYWCVKPVLYNQIKLIK